LPASSALPGRFSSALISHHVTFFSFA